MSGQALTRYDAARKALAEARRVDEVKGIHDKAAAMQLYAKQAKDRDLIKMATEIRMRAEDRAGELLAEMKVKGERISSKDTLKHSRSNSKLPREPKLSDLGVTKIQSSRWQRFAALPPEEKEKRIAAAVEKAEAAVDGAMKQKRNSKEKVQLACGDASLVNRLGLKLVNELSRSLKTLTPPERRDLITALRFNLDKLEKKYAPTA